MHLSQEKTCYDDPVSMTDHAFWGSQDMVSQSNSLYEGRRARTVMASSVVKDKANSQDQVSFNDLLVSIGRDKDKDAFVRIFEYFAPRLKSFLMKAGLADDVAEELVQDIMMTVWRKAPDYDPAKAAASTWIFTIARNKKIDMFRKNARPKIDHNDPLYVDAMDVPLPDENIGHEEEARIIYDALENIPEEQASLLKKSFFEGKTHKDIAEEESLPLGTVKSRIRLALERMRHLVGDKV